MLNADAIDRIDFATVSTADLSAALGFDVVLMFNDFFDAWCVVDRETGDIIGTGEASSEAVAEAVKTVRGWC